MFSPSVFGMLPEALRAQNSFGFIDADNMKKGFDDSLKRAGFTTAEARLFDLGCLFRGFNTKRKFLYSALPENGETHDWITELRSRSGYVFRGTLLKEVGRRKKQEGVDVRLAVEAMQLAGRNKMTHAIVFSGDGDLLPLVNALVDDGIMTAVVSFGNPDLGIVAPRMRDAADQYFFIGREELSECLVEAHRKTSAGSSNMFKSKDIVDRLTSNSGEEFSIIKHFNTGFSLVKGPSSGEMYSYSTFRSLEGLQAWFKLRHQN
jgi:uncharacterized LabA/DUF88 family protein